MAVRTRPPPEGPRAQGRRGENSRKPESEESLPGGLAARLSNCAGGRRPHKFPRPDPAEARKPPRPERAGPAQVKGGLRPPRGTHTAAEEAERERRGLSLSEPRERAPRGAGRGGEDGGRCSLGSGRKSACGGRGRAAGLPGGGAREARELQVPTARAPRPPPPGASFALPGHRVREQAEGSRQPTRGDLRAPPRPPPTAPRGRGKRAPSVRGVARDTEAAGSALCVFPNRGRTCLLPSPPASSPGVSMEVALTA
nr:uncharacterized protein LOC116156303 [Camelus dromedarius]